jgi:sugar phosphate isomerase/epimerase
MIYLSGFADEAADGIDGQIEVTKALGWSFIEARSVDGGNIHDVDDASFDKIAARLEESGVRIQCFGSTIANWGKRIDTDPLAENETVERAVRRMKRLGVSMIRIMSYAIQLDSKGRLLPEQDKALRFSRLKRICSRFMDEGITPVHENCLNYGGISWRHTLELLEAVPEMKLVFDTGNPCLTPDFLADYPYPNQDALEAWNHLKQYVVHIHIKDGWRDIKTGEEHYVYPGEGPCRVREILKDCIAQGYEGWFSIEPHMAAVFHDASIHSSEESRRNVYVEYGRRLEAMLTEMGFEVHDGIVKTFKKKEKERR